MDINGGQLTQTNGNPAFPGTTFTGPLIAGNVPHSDGSGNFAGVGETSGLANCGYAVMAQSSVIQQAGNGGSNHVWFDPNLIIPAQSQILRITLMVTTAWTGAATTLGIGSNMNATAYTAADAGDGSVLGQIVFTPGTDSGRIGRWDNVGTADRRIVITSTNTGSGVGTLTVEYIQGINNAS